MYNNYGFNPYYQTNQNRFQQIEQPIQPMTTQSYIPPVQPTKVASLLGKSVDSIDVVKAMDIPLDGSISYFPIADGSAIVTKQLMMDGTSKTIIYKPSEEEKVEGPKYATIDDIKKSIEDIDLSDIEEDIKELKQELKELKKARKKEE